MSETPGTEPQAGPPAQSGEPDLDPGETTVLRRSTSFEEAVAEFEAGDSADTDPRLPVVDSSESEAERTDPHLSPVPAGEPIAVPATAAFDADRTDPRLPAPAADEHTQSWSGDELDDDLLPAGSMSGRAPLAPADELPMTSGPAAPSDAGAGRHRDDEVTKIYSTLPPPPPGAPRHAGPGPTPPLGGQPSPAWTPGAQPGAPNWQPPAQFPPPGRRPGQPPPGWQPTPQPGWHLPRAAPPAPWQQEQGHPPPGQPPPWQSGAVPRQDYPAGPSPSYHPMPPTPAGAAAAVAGYQASGATGPRQHEPPHSLAAPPADHRSGDGDGDSSRRAILIGGGVAVVAAVGGFVWYRLKDPARKAAPTPYAPPAQGAAAPIAAVSEIPEGGGIVLDDQAIVLTRPAGQDVRAFSAICTHQGCVVSSVGNGRINCPCHGSSFDMTTGARVSGPAQAPLPPIAVRVENGNVIPG